MKLKVEPISTTGHGPACSDTDSVNRNVDGIFRPIHLLLRVSGFYIGCNKHRMCNALELLHCVTMKLVLVFNMARYSTVFLIDTEFGGSLMGSLSLFLLYTLGAILSIVMAKPIYEWLPRFVDDMKSYIKEYGSSPYLVKAKSQLRIILIIGLILDLAYLLTISEGIHSLLPSLRRHLTPFQSASGVEYTMLMALNGYLMMVVGLTFVSIFILFLVLTHCLKLEFSFVSKAFKDALANGEVYFETKFDILRQRHENLCQLTGAANEMVCHFAALVYLFGMPIICCLAFGVIRGSLPVDDIIFNSWNLITVLFYMAFITAMGANLNIRVGSVTENVLQTYYRLGDSCCGP